MIADVTLAREDITEWEALKLPLSSFAVVMFTKHQWSSIYCYTKNISNMMVKMDCASLLFNRGRNFVKNI